MYIIHSYSAFTNHFKEVFGSDTGEISVSDQLLCQRQGSSTTSDYTRQLCTPAVTSGWNEAALHSAYRKGLDPHVCMQMAIYDDNIGLGSFMQRATCISQLLSACQPHEAAHQSSAFTSGPSVPEPMQVDSTWLTLAERARRIVAGLGLYCGNQGNFLRACPVRPPCPLVSTLQVDPEIATLSLLPVQLFTQDHSVSVPALVDSGSSGQFHIPQPLNASPSTPSMPGPRALSQNHSGKAVRAWEGAISCPTAEVENWMSAWGDNFLPLPPPRGTHHGHLLLHLII